MPEESNKSVENAPNVVQETTPKGLVPRILHWTSASHAHMALVGVLLFLGLGSLFATWSYLAHMAVQREFPVSLGMALYALDVKEYDKAKHVIGQLERRSETPQDFGGALFVLGAAKAYQADSEWSLARQRAMYLMAARYLRKALALGVPEDRVLQAKYLLGLSLVRGNQPEPGITELLAIAAEESLPTSDIHSLLTSAYRALPEPDLPSALKHSQIFLADKKLTGPDRAQAIISHAEILGELGQLEAATEQLQEANKFAVQEARIRHVSGQLALKQALKSADKIPEKNALIEQAITDFTEAKRLDPLNGDMARQAMYWIGMCHQAIGNTAAAIETYDRLSRQHGDTSESLAATLAVANLSQATGNAAQALAGYHLVLETVKEPITYVNRLLPLSELRKKMRKAHLQFIEAGQFEQATALADKLQPVFSLIEVTELLAQTQEKWGHTKLREYSDVQRGSTSDLLQEGRYHLRAAGRAYESLAYLRFATPDFTDDLWHAAENYYQGQSFTNATRVLNDFLHHEVQLHQSMGLLRLGQSLLVIGKIKEAVTILEECMELHPRDSVVYQARLECFHAYSQLGDIDKASQLLVTNLTGDTLKPRSPEWRDSLFALGEFHHRAGKYREAIKTLDEAVRRYPNADQTLMARYTIARSYHSAARKPAELARIAKTESERQKNRKLRDQNLEEALQNYIDVQRSISLHGHSDQSELERMLLRNCYMMQGSVLFQLQRYQEARKSYSNISTLYVNEPFVLESFVHIANCWRRLNQPIKAKGTIEQAKLVLHRFPEETDFKIATNFNRSQWQLLLNEMSDW